MDKTTMSEFLDNINFETLKKQKERLLAIFEAEKNQQNEEALQGIINLIDSIQDIAVEEYGYAETNVFNLEGDIDMPDDGWNIVERYLPNYSSRNDVLDCNVLNKFLNGEEISEKDIKWIKESFGTNRNEVLKFACELEVSLFKEAVEAMPSIDDLTQEWVYFCSEHNIPLGSADEVFRNSKLTEKEKAFVEDFIIRWDERMNLENQ